MTTTAPRAVLYGRLSKDRYKGDTDEGVKVEQQLAECRKWAEEHGYTVTGEHPDNDLSATTGVTRPGFEAVLKAIQSGEADVIVCWHTDRFVRRSRDLERVLALRAANGKQVPVYGLHSMYLDLATPAGRATARTVTAWAEYEGEQKSERFALATQRRIERGQAWWPSGPLGFTKEGEHVPEGKALVQEAYRRLLDGDTVSAIARDWNARGITTPKGAIWRPTSVGELLRAPRNAGLLEHKGVVIGKAAWEPLIDLDTWDAALAILRDERRMSGGPRRLTYLLSSVAECGTCNDGTTVWAGPGNRVGRTYRCSRHTHNRRKAPEVEEYVIFRTLAVLSRPENASADETPDPQREALLAERSRLQDRTTELEDMYMDGKLDQAAYLRMSAKAASRLADVEEALRSLTRRVFEPVARDLVYAGDLTQQREVWDALTLARRQEILRSVWDRIVLEKPTQHHAFRPESVTLTPSGGVAEVWVQVRDEPYAPIKVAF